MKLFGTDGIRGRGAVSLLRATAEEALSALPEKDRVHFALKVMLNVTDPTAVSAFGFASNHITEHANILMREAFERGCG